MAPASMTRTTPQMAGPTMMFGEEMNKRAGSALAASVLALAPMTPALAELKQASDGEVYARADSGTLTAARVIERAKSGKLVDGSSATCSELNSLIAVDLEAVQFEKDKLDAMGGKDAAEIKVVADAEKAMETQVAKLEKLKVSKKCS